MANALSGEYKRQAKHRHRAAEQEDITRGIEDYASDHQDLLDEYTGGLKARRPRHDEGWH